MKTNLVSNLKAEQRDELAKEWVEKWRRTAEARREWEEKRAKWFDLWLCKPEKGRRLPWKDASNIALPLASSAINQFHGRTVSSILDAPDIAKIIPIGPEDVPKAKSVERFLNWQLLMDCPDYENQLDKLILKLGIDGTAFFKTSWDFKEGRPDPKFVSALDVYLPFKTEDFAEAEFIIHKTRKTEDQIERLCKSGFYLQDWDEEDLCEKRAPTEDSYDIVKEISDEHHGEKPATDQEYPFTILEIHFTDDIDGLGETERPYTIWVLVELEKTLRIVSRQVDGQTVNLFQDFHFIPNPEGYYSYGFCHFLEPLNKAANTIFNQIFDSGRITNNPFFFYGRRSGLRKRNLELEPGVGYPVEDASQIVFPNMQRLDPSLPMILGMIERYIQLFTSTSEQLQGRQQKGVREPTVGATDALIQQGLVQMGVLARRVYRSHRAHLKQLVALNSLFVEDDKVFRVLGDTSINPFKIIRKNDFKGRFDVLPTADPTWANKGQRRAEAIEIMQVALMHPLIGRPDANGQIANQAALLAFTREWLNSYERPDLARFLPPAPEPMIDPTMENAIFMQGENIEPKPGEDHASHIEVHLLFLNNSLGQSLTKDKKQLIIQHIASHNALTAVEQQIKENGLVPTPGLLPDVLSTIDRNSRRGGSNGTPGQASQPGMETPDRLPRV